MRKFSWYSLVICLVTCVACGDSRPPTSPTFAAPITPSATARVLCPTTVGDSVMLHPTPTTGETVLFRSMPELQTDVVYTGHIGIGLLTTGFQTNYVLLVVNESDVPLTLRADDFTLISIRRQAPLQFQVFAQTGRIEAIDVAPKSTMSFGMSINGVMGDIKATWRIKGNLGTVEIPVYLPPPLPTPTTAPMPSCP